MNQNSYLPISKIQAAGLGAALSIVLVWILSMFGVDMPAEVASAVTALFSVGFGYLKSPSPDDGVLVVEGDNA